jgi:hypothetical protein
MVAFDVVSKTPMKSIGLLCFTLFLLGCEKRNDDWQLSSANGVTYRLNKRTGETFVLLQTQFVRCQDSDSIPNNNPKPERLVINWGSVTNDYLAGLTQRLKTTWRDGKVFYIFVASPYNEKLRSAKESLLTPSQFNIRLLDDDGFEIVEIPVKVSEMVQTIGEDGSPSSLSVNSSLPCPLETYKAARAWVVGWSGFTEKLPRPQE